MINELQTILRSNMEVTDKVNAINKLKNKIDHDFSKALDDIYKNHEYCIKCRKYHKRKLYKTVVEENIHPLNGLVPLPPVHFYNTYTICPLGHKFISAWNTGGDLNETK